MKAREQQKHLLTGRWRFVPIATPKEHELQIQLVTMLRWALRPDVIVFHCPNGELRDKRAASKLRALGTLPGVPDLIFCWCEVMPDDPGGGKQFCVLFLELKRPGGKLSTEQAAFGLAVR